MPLFTDVQEALPAGTTAADLARAQRADLKVQPAHGVPTCSSPTTTSGQEAKR
jgi:hypothetical protein